MSDGDSPLLAQVRSLAAQATELYSGSPHADRIERAMARLDEPLRVAIAGKVKAGKSTLLNALVGEELAPTDEGECTKIVTWYRDGITYRVTLVPYEGEERQVPFTRDAEAIEVDLAGTPPEAVERLLVDWPSSQLKAITLIDTPGIGSLSEDVSARTEAFLTPDDDRATQADAVLYLMKHVHATDMSFLEAFHDEEVSQATPVNAVAILSRADEVGVGRIDAMASANKIATRYRRDPKVRRLAQTVLPVAGLMAQTGSTLTEAEYKALSDLASVEKADLDKLLLSADRFVSDTANVGLTTMEREHILSRLGLFGVRLATNLISQKQVSTAGELATELVGRSGLVELRQVLTSLFADRADVLKARSMLLTVEVAVRDNPIDGSAELANEVERITASAHEFNELRLLNAIRAGTMKAKSDEIERIERVLGTAGMSCAARLGLDEDTPTADLVAATQKELASWQQRAENPMTSKELADASRVLIRTCEGLLMTLTS